METTMISTIDEQIEQYKRDHHGEEPLYMLVSEDEANALVDEVKHMRGYGEEVPVTSYKGVKIVKNDFFKPGELRLTNELPETGS